jgi:hypothetical protein
VLRAGHEQPRRLAERRLVHVNDPDDLGGYERR